MFNVVDTWYGGRLSTTALAAMSLSFPVFFILLSIGTGVSTSATALVGNALGRNATKEAAIYIRQAFSFAFIHAIALTILGIIFNPFIFSSMGASGEYLSLALSYMNIIFAGSFFFMFNFVMSAILNSYGDTATYRNFLITGFFMNMVLDPWFMYGGLGLPALGLRGIALATIVIQCLGNIFLFKRLVKSGIVRGITLRDLMPHWQYFREFFKLGYPSTMNMMTVTLGIFIITWFVGGFGKEAVAAYGIGTRIEQIALLPVMGLNISTLALTAQNYGAGHIDRIREVLRMSLKYGFFLSSLGTIAALAFAGKLLALFSNDPLVISAGIRFLHVEAFVFPAYVLLYICSSAMQGIKRPYFALGIGLYRQIAGPFLVFHLLMTVLGWGIMGIWWGIFMVTWSAAVVFVSYIIWILEKLEKDIISL